MITDLEYTLTNSYKEVMISYMHNHPEAFDEAVRLAISDKQPYAWRAAWLLWSCMKDNDARIQEYIQNIIKVLPDRGDNHQRELLKILLKLEIDEVGEGVLFRHCISLWTQINKKPSVRFSAFQILINIAGKYPDLKHELNLITQEDYMHSLSPVVRKSINKMMNKI